MQVSVESTGTLGRRLTVAIPAADVEKEVQQRLRRLAKNARLPGFRPGKAPLRVLEAKYGGQVLGEVAGSLIESTLRAALAERKLVPAGGPEVEPKTLERGKDLEYVASFDVYPEVTRLDLAGVKIEIPSCEVTEEDVGKALESMRKQRVNWEPVERGAEDGDQVVMDFVGSIGGEPFAGGKAEDYAYVMGSGQLLEDFERGLVGVRQGEQKVIEVSFPDDYRGQDVAGKLASFQVEIKQVNAPRLPEVDKEFAESFGVKDGDVDKLHSDVRDNLQREMQERLSSLTRQRVMDALVESNSIELPIKLVEQEIDRIIEGNRKMLKEQGIPVEGMDPDRSHFRNEAERRVALGLIMYEIVRQRNIQADADQVKARVERMAASYEDPQAFVQWYYSDQNRLTQLEAVVLEEQVVEHLLQSADVQHGPTSFEELANIVG
jgi:trigger factor